MGGSGSEKVVHHASTLDKQNIFVPSDFLPDCGGNQITRGPVKMGA